MLLKCEKDICKTAYSGENGANHSLTIHVLAFNVMYLQIIEIFRVFLRTRVAQQRDRSNPIHGINGPRLVKLQGLPQHPCPQLSSLGHVLGLCWDPLKTALEPLEVELKNLLQKELQKETLQMFSACNI